MTDKTPIKSARGVYYDLTKSPYRVNTPYGDTLRFSSPKKMEIFTREIPRELTRIDKLIDRHHMQDFVPGEIRSLLYRAMYQALYKKVEG